MVPMPKGIILDPAMAAGFRYWLSFVRRTLRIRGKWMRPLSSVREAIYVVNHGTGHNGKPYRSCYRFSWLEAVPEVKE